jgi:hypothetical protein
MELRVIIQASLVFNKYSNFSAEKRAFRCYLEIDFFGARSAHHGRVIVMKDKSAQEHQM